MSDPLSNLEIQDVLSSIRRLVSEDNRTAPRLPPRDEARPVPASGKLVLTEALRVPPEEEAAEAASEPEGAAVPDEAAQDADPDHGDGPAQEEADAEDRGADDASGLDVGVTDHEIIDSDNDSDDGRASSETMDHWSADADADSDVAVGRAPTLEDTIAELEAAVAGIGEEFEPDGSELRAEPDREDEELDAAFETSFGVDEAAGIEDMPVTADEAEGLDAPVTGDLMGAAAFDRPEDDDGADGPTVSETADTAGGDTDDPEYEDAADMPAEEATEAMADATGADAAAEEISDEVAGAAEDLAPDTAETGDEAPAQPASRIRRLNFAPDSAGDEAATAEPTERGAEVRAFPTAAIASFARRPPDGDAPAGDGRDAPAEADASAVSDAGDDDQLPAAEADDAGLFGVGEEAVIDMDMLRELVAEIIREELQGPLGERITRNVRKLVRREISRALEMQAPEE